jgi:hypothetical protein
MNGRQFISVVTTALMLACPFMNSGHCCGICPSHLAKAACGHDHRSAGNVDPCERDQDAPCDHDCPHEIDANCICHGAIVPDAQRRAGRDKIAAVANVWTDADFTAQLALPTHDPARCHGCHFPPFLSGRDICTLVNRHLL